MRTGRYTTSRQKACYQCRRSKQRCKFLADGCLRCLERGLTCSLRASQFLGQTRSNENTNDPQSQTLPQNDSDSVSQLQIGESNPEPQALPQADRNNDTIVSRSNAFTQPSTSISEALTAEEIAKLIPTEAQPSPIGSSYPDIDIELICTINAKDIRNRWLSAFAPEPGQTTKEYPPHVTSYIFRMLKSYTATIIRGKDMPPFLHQSHAVFPAIQRCLALVQTCTRLQGFMASIIAGVLEDQIDRTYGPSDFATLRQEFQANLIYMMVLYFYYKQDDDAKALLRRGIVNLQQLACHSTETGIVCLAERDGVRPRWEAWVAAETQRRSIYLMYMFDNLLSARDGFQTYLGTELSGLPAPSAKDLWYARTRREWETLYDEHLKAETIPGIPIDYLWPVPADLSGSDKRQRQKRIDRWLEDVDEFGAMLYAVTCCTHGDISIQDE